MESVTSGDAYQFFLRYRGARDNAGDILACLMKNGIRVHWFAENETDLENVYLNMTNEDAAQSEKGKEEV